jgi:hypothetical protein
VNCRLRGLCVFGDEIFARPDAYDRTMACAATKHTQFAQYYAVPAKTGTAACLSASAEKSRAGIGRPK